MPDLIIENVPEETIKALEMLAERWRMSVSQIALEYLPKSVFLSPQEAVRLARELRAMAPKPLYPDSTPGIRADRDSR
jgi:hypothetical protein